VLQDERPTDGYDPRVRPFYQAAVRGPAQGLWLPAYEWVVHVGGSGSLWGLSYVKALRDAGGRLIGVLDTDLDLPALNRFLRAVSAEYRVELQIVELGEAPRLLGGKTVDGAPSAPSAELADLIAASAAPEGFVDQAPLGGGRHWVGARRMTLPGGVQWMVVVSRPASAIDASLRRQLLEVGGMGVVLVLALALISARLARRFGQPLRELEQNVAAIEQRGANAPVVLGAATRAFQETLHLGQGLERMSQALRQREEDLSVSNQELRATAGDLVTARTKLAQIVDNGIRLGRERDRDKLLRDVLFGARDIAHCQAATLFIRTEQQTLRFALRTSDDELPSFEIPLYDHNGEPVHQYVSTHVALTAQSVVIDDVYAETRFDLSGTRAFSEASGMRVVSMLTVPLYPREGEVIGILQMLNCLDPDTGAVLPFDPETVGFIEALAAQSAVTIENQNLLLAQKELMDAMIKVIAGAIDAKSAYTGGHCERVPELALMLAEAATQVKHGPLAEFGFHTEDEWTEFRIGAWLHDCGKMTTPEYVVDKATKLETLYNRIHEVRTRFEVLLRDAEIATHRAIAAGQEADSAWAAFETRQAQLQADFAFVAETNLGAESMAPGSAERIRAIAGQTWWRHFDDRIGLSHGEETRLAGVPAPALPALETLLADKPQHIVPRGKDAELDPKHGFQVQVPEHLYHHGEIHNLCIARGTLTEEERFKINEHIIQTIVMLDGMPFPKHLRRVPEYAGTHHETLIGTGYPRKLTAQQMSVPSRIMAIADIFEALTASDRPYKKAKTLSECIRILSFFKKDRHIDPVLFDLFLTSGVYRRYAERYLRPEQIDEVNIQPYLG
jgi:HD-GYP domain-containing protein (c-di-GMP phosphodiesterase class II)